MSSRRMRVAKRDWCASRSTSSVIPSGVFLNSLFAFLLMFSHLCVDPLGLNSALDNERKCLDLSPQSAVLGIAQGDARDNRLLDIAGAFYDPERVGVAQKTLRRILGGEPIAAEDLHRLAGGMDGGFGGEQLRHRRLVLVRQPLILEPGGPIHQEPGSLMLGHH